MYILSIYVPILITLNALANTNVFTNCFSPFYLYSSYPLVKRSNVLYDAKQPPLRSLQHKSRIEIYPLKKRGDDDARKVPKLPKGEFRPKQSLGQNFITDYNLIRKMCGSLDDGEDNGGDGRQVIEVGAGIGSITKFLYEKYPKMTGSSSFGYLTAGIGLLSFTAIEIDIRAISQLSRNLPNLDIIHDDVLQVDYSGISRVKGVKLWVIGNLPFYITSQILFCLVDYKNYIDRAVITSQLEVARRIVAKPGDKDYSILSVVLQLYAEPKLLFKIPNQAFYPVPKVQSGVIKLTFDPNKKPKCAPFILKRILKDSFRQRRKMLKSCLSEFLEQQEIAKLPDYIANRRPQELSPKEFEQLAIWIQNNGNFSIENTEVYKICDNRRVRSRMGPEALLESNKVWRQLKHGDDEE